MKRVFIEIFVLIFLGMAVALGARWAHAEEAEEKRFTPLFLLWWCHGRDDVMRAMDAPIRSMPRLLMQLTALGKCGFGAYGERYTFLPSGEGEILTTPTGMKYALVEGVIFPKELGISVFTAAQPGLVKRLNNHKPATKPKRQAI